jgi:hypothetical protein
MLRSTDAPQTLIPEPPNSNSTEASIDEFIAIKAWTEKEMRRRLDKWKAEEEFVASLHAELKAIRAREMPVS